MTFYRPDRTFVKDLGRLDKNLGCHYESDHQHFVVTYKRSVGGAVPLFAVKRDDGGFRQPDKRDIERLKESDIERESPQERMQRASKYMSDVREVDRKRGKDDIRNMTKEGSIQLQNVINKASGSGKGNSAFRRIKHAPKGEVF